MQKYLSSCHKELDGHILRINISLQGYCKKKPWIHLLKGKIGGYNFKLFLPQLEYMKELCFLPIKNMHLYSGLNYRFAAGTCNNACFILWTGGSFCRLFTDVFFFIANPWIIIAVPEKIEAIISGNSISARDSPHF